MAGRPLVEVVAPYRGAVAGALAAPGARRGQAHGSAWSDAGPGMDADERPSEWRDCPPSLGGGCGYVRTGEDIHHRGTEGTERRMRDWNGSSARWK